MFNILGRLYNIARSNSRYYAQLLKDKTFGSAYHGDNTETKYYQDDTRNQSAGGSHSFSENDIPSEVIDDLKIFSLSPPSSLEEVRKARNREIKKCHSDMFQNDPDKLETSKQIMQIYNAAYTRLEKYYSKK